MRVIMRLCVRACASVCWCVKFVHAQDSDRAGVLDKEDIKVSMKRVGLALQDHEIDTLLAYYDNHKQDGGLSYHSFLECFGTEAPGYFNPFKPNVPLHVGEP